MKRYYSSLIGLIAFLVLVMSLSGCGQMSNFVPTATAYPTYTPLPTYAPLPTYTPFPTSIPNRWDVKVLSVTTPTDFDGFSPKADTSTYIVITIEYTYHGTEPTVFSPGSLVLLNTTTSVASKYEGVNNSAIRYQPEGISSSISLSEESPVVNISPGTTRVDKFGWVFPKVLTNFRLFFPETEAIEIVVN